MEKFHAIGYLREIVIILATAGILVPVLSKLRISPVLGYLIAGFLVGPFGLGSLQLPALSYFTINNPGQVAHLAEFGVVFLLFMIGLELSPRRLWDMRKLVFGLGFLQVMLSAAVIGPIAYMFGNSLAAIDVMLKTESGPKTHSVPMLLRKYGRKKLVLDAHGKEIAPTRGNKDKALINALVRAHKWERALTSNSQRSLGTIAKAEDLEQKYVTRIYRLNFLAPKIKEAILDGMQPGTLTLSRLMQGIPLSWREQEHLYGF